MSDKRPKEHSNCSNDKMDLQIFDQSTSHEFHRQRCTEFSVMKLKLGKEFHNSLCTRQIDIQHLPFEQQIQTVTQKAIIQKIGFRSYLNLRDVSSLNNQIILILYRSNIINDQNYSFVSYLIRLNIHRFIHHQMLFGPLSNQPF